MGGTDFFEIHPFAFLGPLGQGTFEVEFQQNVLSNSEKTALYLQEKALYSKWF